MLAQTFRFDHSAESIHAVFGISQHRAMEITGSIIFTEIDKAHTAFKLFDNPEEAPMEFTTKTGVLDAVFGDLKNDNEALFATFEWGKHITLSTTKDDYKSMLGQMGMFYMLTDGDRDKFLTLFTKSQSESED